MGVNRPIPAHRGREASHMRIKINLLLAGIIFMVALSMALLFDLPRALAADGKNRPKLTGKWEIHQAKEPGKPYRKGYRGRPFVSEGPNAYTIVVQYNPDGTFKRISKVGGKKIVDKGEWQLQGSELRQRQEGDTNEEVIYIRFDTPDQYTSIEVFEATHDPGTFARYKRIK